MSSTSRAALPPDPDCYELYNEGRWSALARQYGRRMHGLLRELALVIVLTFVYAALTSDSPKVSRSPQPFPFFPRNCTSVVDWYRGELGLAISQAQQSDISFIMYYASWSADCQAARDPFQQLANHMVGRVAFSAVNCWQPGGECRTRYSKATSWPILIAYVGGGRGVQYRGPIEVPHMMRFLMAVEKPVARVTEDNLWSFVPKHDAVLVGFINPLPGSFDFSVFYTAALQFLEKDPFQDTAFAIHTVAATFGSPEIHLMLWNETLIFNPTKDDWNPDSLISWALKHIHQVTMWISPSNRKSNVLFSYIDSNPGLILFTPRNLLHGTVDYYDLLLEIGLRYYSCGNKSEHVGLTKRLAWHVLNRVNNYKKFLSLSEGCFNEPVRSHMWINGIMQSGNFCYHGCSYELEGDPRSASNLQLQAKSDLCRTSEIAHTISSPLFSETSEQYEDWGNITGLACETNASLSLMVFDSLRDYHFAERLGLDLHKTRYNTAAVIVNSKMETHHIMQGPINDRTLSQFIRNFTDNVLSRAVESLSNVRSKHTHFYPEKVCGENEICVPDLDSTTFLPTIMKQNKAFIVFYHSRQCSFCSGVAHKLLWVAKIFQPMIAQLAVVRVDGDINVLPWEFTMYTYPTILFVPALKKSESRIYPSNLMISVPNLVRFVIANLDSVMRLRAMWIACGQNRFEDEKQKCVVSVRVEALSIIAATLRQWRKSHPRHRPKLVYALQQLRQLHLLLAHFPQKKTEIDAAFDALYL